MLNHLHELKYYLFSGLDYSEIGNENNFLHLNRQYCQPKGQNNDVRPDYNGSIDFLQSIDKDIPKGILFAYYFQRKLLMNSFNFLLGCWASRLFSNRYFIIHNLLWPGAVYVQDMNIGLHGYFYNGYGLKNLDLPFMI